MDATPEVSVVIPTRDRVALLTQTLRSVLGQTNVDFEVIVVDDGSVEDVGAALGDMLDSRGRLLRNETSLGVSAARNRGIDTARGAWVACVDDDDLWAPDKLRRQLDAVRPTGRKWVYTGAVNVSPALQVVAGGPPSTPEEVVAKVTYLNLIPGGTSSVMADRTLMMEVGGFDTELQPFADWDLWIRLAASGLPAFVPSPLVAYRVHAGNMTVAGEAVERDLAIFARRGIDVDRAAIYRWLGWSARRGGRTGRSIRYLLRAWRSGSDAYGLGDLAGDISYVGREAAERFRLRYLKRILGRPLVSERPGGDPDWISEAERWIGEFSANQAAG